MSRNSEILIKIFRKMQFFSLKRLIKMIKFQGKVQFDMFLKSSKNDTKSPCFRTKLKNFGLFPDIFYGCVIWRNENRVKFRGFPRYFKPKLIWKKKNWKFRGFTRNLNTFSKWSFKFEKIMKISGFSPKRFVYLFILIKFLGFPRYVYCVFQ